MATNASPQTHSEVVSKIIDDASKNRRQLVEGTTYIALQNLLIIKCESFWIPIDVSSIIEFREFLKRNWPISGYLPEGHQ